MKHKGKKVLSLLLAALMIVGLVMPSGALAPSAKAAAGDVPAHEKTLTVNDDGTYTIALSVTGDADTEIDANKVNVVVVVDISGSMDYPANTAGRTTANNPTIGRYGTSGSNYRRLYYRTGSGGNYTYYPEGTGPQSTQRHGTVYTASNINNNGAVTYSQYNGTRYNFTSNDTRLDVTKTAVNNLIDTLLAQNTGNISDMIEVSFVTFSSYAYYISPSSASNSGWTSGTSGTALKGLVSGTMAGGGTNWDAALYNAKQQADAKTDDDKTFVVFFSDGEPTFHYGNATSATNHTHNTTLNGDGNSTGNADLNAAYYEASQLNTEEYDLYGIFAYGSDTGKTYMQNLVNYGNGSTDGFYYSADSEDEIRDAFAAIATAIASAAGIANAAMSDGTTSAVETSTGEIASLLQVDETSYEYWLSWQMPSGSNKITMFIGGSEREYTISTSGDNVTITWDDGSVSYPGTYNGNAVKIKWEEATDFYGFAPPAAKLTDGAVDWDLKSIGTLLDGVTYTITFDTWPSQTTLDIVADIKNNPGADGAWKDLDPEVQKYIDVNGNLKTNTTASLSYTDTRTGESGSTEFVNPDPVSNTAVEQLTVAKEWENELDSYEAEPVTLDVLRDGEKAYKIRLGDNDVWSGSVYISIGIIKNGQPLSGAEGHDFTFAEPEGVSYHWELNIPTVHPMMINGETVMLIKVDEKHEAPAGADTYTFNGATYYVDEEIASLTAINERRSSLNLIKAVEGEDVPEDAVFPFTLNIVNSLAPESEPENDPGHDSDYWVWISVRDGQVVEGSPGGNPVTDAVESGAESAGGGWYYGKSGDDIVLNVKAGYSIRLNNLPTGSSYTITEGTLPTGFIFKSAAVEVTEGEGTADTFEVTGTSAAGEIESTNSLYVVTFTNKYELIDINVDKVWDDNSDQDGIRPEELELTLNGLPSGTTAPEPEIVESEDGNTWTYTWKAVPRYDADGNELTYTVTEDNVPEGYTCETATASDDGIITNSHTPEVADVTVTKAWDDASNQDGKRPTALTLTLNNVPSGVTVPDPTIAKDGDNWTYTWKDLPKYSGGEEIEYTITEGTVPTGYTCETPTVKAGGTITNSHEPDKDTITVTKVWEDASDQDGVRPESVKFTVTGSDGKTYEVELEGEGDTWTAEVEVEKYTDGGTEVTFTVDEEDLTSIGYEKTIDGLTITNKYEPEKTKITVTKVWEDAGDQDGLRPDSVKFIVTGSDGKTYEVELEGEGDTWTAEVEVAKYYDGGKDVTFTIEEEEVKNYSFRVDNETLTITNTYPPETDTLTVTKVWDDAGNQDGKRPDSVKFTVTGSDGNTYEATLSGTGDTWTATIEDVAKYFDHGETVTFTVEEEDVDGYEAAIDNDKLTITNSYEPETAKITVTKIWDDAGNQDGNRPESVKFTVTGSDGKTYEVELEGEGDTWTAEVEVEKYTDGGKEVTFTVDEEDVDGYEKSIDGLTITNSYEPEEDTITVTKIWDDASNQDGKRPESVKFTVTGSDGKTYEVELTGDGDKWTKKVKVEKYADGGKEVTFTVDEEDVPGYEKSIDGLTITNSCEPETDKITVTKIWDDAGNQDGNRPESVKFIVTGSDGKTYEVELEGEGDTWTAEVEVEKYTDGGKEVTFTVDEEDVDGYEKSIDGLTITNSYEPEEDTITVTKIWDDASNQDGKRPDSVKFTVTGSDGKTYEVELTGNGDKWTKKVKVEKYAEGGKEVTFTVDEEDVPGYEKSIDGLTITNSCEPETTKITVTKVWDDANDQDGKRPGSVKFTVTGSDGKTYEVELKGEGDTWTAEVEVEKYYEGGKEVTFTVDEAAVSDYSKQIDDDALTITNSYTPGRQDLSVTKVWDDGNDKDGLRPESIDVKLMVNGEECESVTLDESNSWKYSWNLPAKQNGEDLVYTVEEDVVPAGYVSTVSGSAETGYIITNTHSVTPPPPPPPVTIKIRIVKRWDDNGNAAGKRPDSVTVTLMKDDVAAVVEKLGNWNGWQYEWNAIGGSNYSVIEDPVDGYETSIERSYFNNVITFTVTNKLTETPVLNTKDHVAYIVGYPDGTVRPGREITRAEVATIFFRLLTDEARDLYWSQTNPYPDVQLEDWFNNAISTLTNMGIINGYEDGTFRPNNFITRAELTKIAVCFFTSADQYFGKQPSFTDVPADAWYTRFIAAAEELGLINGYPDGTFRPGNPITRAETCTIVNRTLGRVPEKDHLLPYMQMINWPDNANTNEWYYAQIQEATNSHDYVWTVADLLATVEQWTAKLPERNWVALEQVWSNSHSAPGGEVMDYDPIP